MKSTYAGQWFVLAGIAIRVLIIAPVVGAQAAPISWSSVLKRPPVKQSIRTTGGLCVVGSVPESLVLVAPVVDDRILGATYTPWSGIGTRPISEAVINGVEPDTVAVRLAGVLCGDEEAVILERRGIGLKLSVREAMNYQRMADRDSAPRPIRLRGPGGRLEAAVYVVTPSSGSISIVGEVEAERERLSWVERLADMRAQEDRARQEKRADSIETATREAKWARDRAAAEQEAQRVRASVEREEQRQAAIRSRIRADSLRAANQAAAKERAIRLKARRIALEQRGWNSRTVEAVLSGQVLIGMNARMVEEAWGPPSSKNATITAAGTEEQWVYPNQNYVYLGTDGLVRTIQLSR